MKENLLTEKEMVLLVLLYFHGLNNLKNAKEQIKVE